jgi:hypothetical protein
MSNLDELIEFVRLWSDPGMWEATWKLETERQICRGIRTDDPFYESTQQRAVELFAKWCNRIDQLKRINQLVESHAPELLGKVPFRPYQSTLDHKTATALARQMKCLLGSLLAKRTTSGGSDAVRPAPAAERAIDRVRSKDSEGRMYTIIQDDPASINWTAKEWGLKLKRKPSTVKGYKTWKQMVMAGRAMKEAERVSRTGDLDGGNRGRRKRLK